MNRYLIVSTVFAIFSEALTYHFVIDLKLFYFILFLNIIILISKAGFHISIISIKIFLILTFLSLISVIRATNEIQKIIPQLLGIFFTSQYFYLFFKYLKEEINYIFELYCKFALVNSIFGVIFSFGGFFILNEYLPVKGIMLEPAHFATITLPAWYFLSKSISFFNWKTLTLLFSIILSFSSLGILGLIFGILLYPKKISIKKIIIPSVLSTILFVGLYNNLTDFKIRIDDTIHAFDDQNLNGANLSTYAILSNYFVAKQSFSNSPIIGSGIGSHPISHKKYIDTIDGIEFLAEEYRVLNANDANSLFLRLLSELGLFGIAMAFYFILKFYSFRFVDKSKSILIYFFCKLFREGHYFSPEMYFFINIYALNKIDNDHTR